LGFFLNTAFLKSHLYTFGGRIRYIRPPGAYLVESGD
jgi:hypothetical protein